MNIKEIRTCTGMTQKQFAEYLNIPKRSIENWEQKKKKPPVYLVELIQYKCENEGLIK